MPAKRSERDTQQEVAVVSHEQSVLIVHPDPVLRAGLAEALAPRKIVAVGSRDDATRTLAEGVPDIILADAVGARKFIQAIERLAPRALRVFLCPGGTQAEALQELVDVASEGHEFHTMDLSVASLAGLSRALGTLLRQRTSMRLPAVGLEASFVVDDSLRRAVCLDFGNEGFQLKLPVDAPIERMVPGTRLTDFRLEIAGRTLLRTSAAFVRHVGMEHASADAFFRVGVQIERPNASIGYVEMATLDDRVRILAVLRRALRYRQMVQCTLMQGVRVQEELHAQLVPMGERLTLRCALPRNWTAVVGDVVHLVFELSGKSYRGWTSVLAVEQASLMLALPRSLSLYHRRNQMRFRAGAEDTFGVSFVSPLTGQRIERPVVDLHTVGLAFLFEGAREVLPAGLLIDDFHLVLPDGRRARCGAEVRDSAPVISPEGQELTRPFRAGVRLNNVPHEARQAILDAFVKSRYPHMRDGRHETFHDIWSLIHAAGLFHPDYPFEDGPHTRILEDTHHTLSACGEDIAKTFLYAQGDQLVGHISGLRTHSRTWMMQHLAVHGALMMQGARISRELCGLAVDYAEMLEDVNYLRVCWRVQNRWPERVFGWMARSMHMEGLTLLRHYQYMRLPTMLDARVRPGLPSVRRATMADLRWLESHLRSRGEVVRLLADDLLAHDAEMSVVGARYTSKGLHRRRTLFVVDGEKQPLAMALALEASPGLSWSEMTTYFTLVVPDPSHPRAAEARQALISRCVQHYREHGKVSALALAAHEDVADLLVAGFQDHGTVAEWTFHRSTARTCHTLLSVLYDRFEGRLARKATPGEDIAA
jgi:hypothetical protein